MEEKTQKKAKRYLEKKKMSRWVKTVLILIVLIVSAFVILAGKIVMDKLGKIHFQDLDESNLSINDNLYNQVDGLTKKEYQDVINILLLGSDSKDMDSPYSGSSDAIMIISIHPKYKSLKLISIPRDTAAKIEGFDHRYKINAAFATGKEQLAVKTINENFGLDLKEYVTINISAMYEIINALGGIELEITKEEMYWINEYVDMFYKFSGKPTKKVTKYGKVKLTGEQAAAHVKERKAGSSGKSQSHGDYGRTVRQREVLLAMLNQLLSKDIDEISKSIDLILEQITTNVDIGKYLAMLPEWIANKDAYMQNVISVMLPALEYSNEILENGAYLYVTDMEKAKRDFIKYMYEM